MARRRVDLGKFGESAGEDPTLLPGQGRTRNTIPDTSRKNSSSAPAISHYEKNREFIIQLYEQNEGNVSAVERELAAREIRCSGRWLRTYLERWGVHTSGRKV